MTRKTILFDLDGTLTDSGEGILSCGEAVLRHFGLPVPPREEMRCMVGPPLKESFTKFGIKTEDLDAAVEVYREHYHAGGMFQNFPYPGIRQVLDRLKAQGHRLCVATSKPEYMAKIILEHFELADRFSHICGASRDGIRGNKAQVIEYLLQQLSDDLPLIMVGDTVFDVLGAKEFGIPTVGVSWGYGDQQQMLSSGAVGIAHTMDELLTLLQS